jgi:Na+/H+ antiporter NhaD/arsenite permease-like protein
MLRLISARLPHACRLVPLIAVMALLPDIAFAADGLDGAKLSAFWALPFAGILICIATGPVLYPHLWEHHYGKFAALFGALVTIPLYLAFDTGLVTATLSHTVLLEYMPFILLLLALFTVAGGIYIEGNLHDSAFTNTALLGIGALLASVVGTTGASMILIRPLIRANDDRNLNVHVVVFFIFLVSNIGGSLSPLGDPPLFLGFLKGVDFFWTTTHLFKETLLVGGIVLAVFAMLDVYLHHREGNFPKKKDPTPDSPLRLHGRINLLLMAVIIGAILISASWKPGVTFTLLGTTLQLQDLLRDAVLVLVTIASLLLTNKAHRAANGFNWGPIREVAVLFAGIFLCIVPVMAMLQAGAHGAFAPLVALVTHADGTPNNLAYFWLTGGLSSFLDNAPTYLVFFEMAGGDAKTLMTTGAMTLAAISAGAVFMGANSYIGNAPNFMVYAIATERGVKMPSFFGYMIWSALVLLPVFAILNFVWVARPW